MKLFNPILSTFFLLMIVQVGCAQSKVFTNEENIALGGYDVVAYHNVHEAVRGSSEFSALIDEVTYYFSSAANQKAFEEKPEAYLPKYGGYCAFGMGMQGALVPSNPETFKIRDGVLYLFFNDYYQGKPFNTIVPWNGNEKEMMTKADTNWTKK